MAEHDRSKALRIAQLEALHADRRRTEELAAAEAFEFAAALARLRGELALVEPYNESARCHRASAGRYATEHARAARTCQAILGTEPTADECGHQEIPPAQAAAERDADKAERDAADAERSAAAARALAEHHATERERMAEQLQREREARAEAAAARVALASRLGVVEADLKRERERSASWQQEATRRQTEVEALQAKLRRKGARRG